MCVFQDKKTAFIDFWGKMSSKWGINKTMTQIHALLLINNEPLCAEKIQQELSLSSGCVNMNIRELLDWNLIKGVTIAGERREYFEAEKDLGKVFKLILKKRKEQELDPLKEFFQQITEDSQSSTNTEEEIQFYNTMNELKLFANRADNILGSIANTKTPWLISGMNLLMR